MSKKRMCGEAKNIRIYQDTKTEFEKLGRYGESADDILRRLIHHFKIHHVRLSDILIEDTSEGPSNERRDDL